MVVLILIMAAGFFGCERPLRMEREGSAGTAATVVGDWDDVEAAAAIGTGEAEVSILTTERDEREIRFSLRTVGGEGGELVAAREEGASVGGSERIRLSARITTFGDRAAEAHLIDRVAARLRRLAGVEWAPR
jgi:hypothetical protein